jgi:hypothetical protein
VLVVLVLVALLADAPMVLTRVAGALAVPSPGAGTVPTMAPGSPGAGPAASAARSPSVGAASARPTLARPTAPVYGPAIAADTLSNTHIGGTNYSSRARTSFRFRATQTASLEVIRPYLVDGERYAGGDGGTIEVTIERDDGTTLHAPDGTVLASTRFRPGNPIRRVSAAYRFADPPHLVAGRLYHVVFRNVDDDPGDNYVSVNALFAYGPRVTPRQPGVADVDWGQLLHDGEAWRERENHTPILELDYSNGESLGVGYMEAWETEQPLIHEENRVRERFRVSGPDRPVTGVAIRLHRDSAAETEPLAVYLEDGDGARIASGSIPASRFPVGQECSCRDNINGWGWTPLEATLRSGSVYNLVLESAGFYRAVLLREGVDYAFSEYFSDGRAESNAGRAWTRVQAPYGGNRGQGDLQFYFY